MASVLCGTLNSNRLLQCSVMLGVHTEKIRPQPQPLFAGIISLKKLETRTLKNIEREKGVSVFFQQDGAPPLYSLSTTGSLVVGWEGMVLFCGHLKAPISRLWTFSSCVISRTLFTLKNSGHAPFKGED
jgi:hypothetical protein